MYPILDVTSFVISLVFLEGNVSSTYLPILLFWIHAPHVPQITCQSWAIKPDSYDNVVLLYIRGTAIS